MRKSKIARNWSGVGRFSSWDEDLEEFREELGELEIEQINVDRESLEL